MKGKVVLGGLAVIGILALSATGAQAGGGGGKPFPLTSFFVCQGITGEKSGLNVDVEASRLDVNPQNVTLGNGVLACVVAKLFHSGPRISCSADNPCTGKGTVCSIPENSTTGVCEIAPNPDNLDSDGLKCYAVSGPKAPTAPISNTYNITDDLFPTPEGVPEGVESGVAATKFQYICSPALFNFVP
jgi:hypothetical protein